MKTLKLFYLNIYNRSLFMEEWQQNCFYSLVRRNSHAISQCTKNYTG